MNEFKEWNGNLAMKTSCFNKYTGEDGVAVCLFPPTDWSGMQFPALAPDRQTFYAIKAGKITQEEYEKRYKEEILAKLDAFEVYKMFKGNVLLCWESTRDYCHRRLIAEWIEEKVGIHVPEWKPSDEKKINKNVNPLF